ncbi:MAG: ATP-binding protein, partial [Polyangia bacterium]|nr:ATP-binding protein [Polyangia bacterium]
ERLGLPLLATRALQGAAQIEGRRPEVSERSARLLLGLGDADQAARKAREGLEAAREETTGEAGSGASAKGGAGDGWEQALHLVLGEASLEAGHLEEALGAFNSVELLGESARDGGSEAERLRRADLVGRSLVGAARVALRQGSPEEATALLLRAVERRPLLPEVARRIGDLAGALPTWAKIEERVQRLRQERPEEAAVHYLAARLLASAQQNREPGIPGQEIERLLGLALSRDAGCHLGRLMLALRLARRRFLSEDGRSQALGHLRFLSQALRLDPKALGVDAGLVDLLLAAILEENPATAAQAMDFYLAGLRRLPAHAVASTNLGALHLARGEVEAARERLLAALSASPDYAPAYHHLVRTLDLSASPEALAREVQGLVERVTGSATTITGRIVATLAEDTRDQVFEALHSKAMQLHTLLGVIHARLSSSLREDELPPQLRERFNELSERLDEVRRDWRLYLRSLHEGEELSPEVLNLNLLVSEVIRDETGNDGRVELHSTTGLPDVKGQRAALYEALGAVVRNGLEAQPPACLPLQVRTSAGSPLSTRVILEVRDFGPGILALHRAQVFSPGFSTKRDRRGFGLGLARRIVTAHRGWLVVEPAKGRGAVVHIVLPADLHGLPSLLDQPLQLSVEETAGSAEEPSEQD